MEQQQATIADAVRWLIQENNDYARQGPHQVVGELLNKFCANNEEIVDWALNEYLRRYRECRAMCYWLTCAVRLAHLGANIETLNHLVVVAARGGFISGAQRVAGLLQRTLDEGEVRLLVLHHANSGSSLKRTDDELLALGQQYDIESWVREQLDKRDRRYSSF